VYLETAKIYGKKEDYSNAIDFQSRAIGVFQEIRAEE